MSLRARILWLVLMASALPVLAMVCTSDVFEQRLGLSRVGSGCV